MTNFIPIFPLSIVVYPGEKLNLHIFEPRYRQLINECVETGKPFGIPTVINKEVCESGTLLKVIERSKIYEDGKMDVRTEGLSVFKILELVKDIPDKLYSGAIVNYPENMMKSNSVLLKRVIRGMLAIHEKLGISKPFEKEENELTSYDLAHHVGLPIEEEYRLLQILDELQRLEFLKQHVEKLIPVMEEMENLRRRIRQNGHFRNLEGFKFN